MLYDSTGFSHSKQIQQLNYSKYLFESMTFTIITQFESDRTFATVTETVDSQEESVQSQDSFDLSNNFALSSNNVSNNHTYSQQEQSENASSPSSPRGITKKKRKNSKNSVVVDFPSVITTVSNNNNSTNSTPTQQTSSSSSQYQDDMWMQGVLFQFKNSCLCSSYSSSYSIKQTKKPSSNPTSVLVSNRRTI